MKTLKMPVRTLKKPLRSPLPGLTKSSEKAKSSRWQGPDCPSRLAAKSPQVLCSHSYRSTSPGSISPAKETDTGRIPLTVTRCKI